MNWYDLNPDERRMFIESEVTRIARRYSRLIVAAGKRSEKKIGADKSDGVSVLVASLVKEKITI